jgi:hypothetical protein
MATPRQVLPLALLLLASVAHAQDATPSPEDMEVAKIHYQAGSEHYARAHYSEAILEFKEAYRLSHLPALLYNISQSYEKASDWQNSRDFLKQYIDSGQTEPGELPQLQDKLKSLDEKIAAQPKPPVDNKVTPPITPSNDTPPPPKTPYRTWKWVTVISGGVLLGGAVLFGLDSSAMNKKIQDAANQTPPNQYTDELAAAYDRGQHDNALAVTCFIAGTALAATGIVLFYLDGKARARLEHPPAATTTFIPVVSPRGAGAALLVQF